MRGRSWHVVLAVFLGLSLIASACGGSDGDDTTAAADDPDAAETVTDDPSDDGGTDSADDEGDAEPDQAEAADGDVAAPLEDEEQLTSQGEGGSGSDSEPGDAVFGGEVTWGLTNDGSGFDTTGTVSQGSIRIINSLSDPICGLTLEGGWAPNTAESVVPNDDFTVWTITMRPGITFHDGAPLDAAAVVANMQAYKNSPTVGFGFAPVQEIVAIDELSLEVRMSSPWAAFPFTLVNQPGWMVSPETIGRNDTFVGTGPFMLESWTPGDGAKVVRNPNYWRDELPYLDAINFKFLVEQTVKRQALEAGDIHGYISPGDEDIVDYLGDDGVDVWIGTAGANEYVYILNVKKEPVDDIRVRQALAYAVDRQFLIDTFRSGLTTPADGPINPSSQWFAQTDYPDYDPDRAAELVAEYEADVGPIEFEVSIEPNPSVVEVLEVVISFWQDAGIDASIKEIGLSDSVTRVIVDDFQAISWFQFGSPDPDGLYVFMHSNGGILNWSNLESAKMDEGLDLGRQNPDYETRLRGYTMVQEALAEELPMIWIDHLNGVEAAVTIPELHGIGQSGELPDGEASLPMTDGSFFSWTGVWLEQ